MATGVVRREYTTLFERTNGAESGTLSKSIANYEKLRITWGTSDRNYMFTDVVGCDYTANHSYPLSYTTKTSETGNMYITMIRVTINGTALTSDRNFSNNVHADGSGITTNAAGLKVFRIEGA